MRIFANYHKAEEVRFISHLDMQRLLQRAFRRAQVPLEYSKGFNPHPLLSFASALAVGYTSETEWLDVRLEKEVDLTSFQQAVNAVLPVGVHIGKVLEAPQELPTLTALTQSALHQVCIYLENSLDENDLRRGIETLLNGEIIVKKRTKAGERMVDIRPQLLSIDLLEAGTPVVLDITGLMNVDGALHIDLLLQQLMQAWGALGTWRVHRKHIYFKNTGLLPL